MQVILDPLFACPGSAPIWGGKKGEFRDWIKLVRAHHLVNPYTDLTNCLRGKKYFFRETNTVFGDTSNSLLATKYFLWETNTVFRDTNNSLQLREPNMFFGKSIVSLETQITPFREPNISFWKPILAVFRGTNNSLRETNTVF